QAVVGWSRRGIRRARYFPPDGLSAGRQIPAAFFMRWRYYMTPDILWTADALFQGTQARNPRPDREESLGAASRKGRARYRRSRPDEGRRPHPWRFLRPLRFARGAGGRGLQ